MKIVKCDLCGAPCGNEKNSNAWSVRLIPPFICLPSDGWDLCDTCAKKLTEFLEKEVRHEADD